MNRYPNEVISLSRMFGKSVRLHYLTLKHSILFIFLITVIKFIAALGIDFTTNSYLEWLIAIIATFLIVYCFSAALYGTQAAFKDAPEPLMQSVRSVWQHKYRIYSTFWIYVLGAVVLYYVLNLLMFGIEHFFGHLTTIHTTGLIITAALLIVYVSMLYFSYPLTIIDGASLSKSFQDSAELTDKNKFSVLASLVLLFVVALLVTPGMMYEYLLSIYHLNIVFDFIVFSVGIPLYINLLLLVIHDAKLQ